MFFFDSTNLRNQLNLKQNQTLKYYPWFVNCGEVIGDEVDKRPYILMAPILGTPLSLKQNQTLKYYPWFVNCGEVIG